MAKNVATEGTNAKVNLELSKASLSSMDAFLDKLGAASVRMNDLVSLTKKLESQQKALAAKAALSNLDAYNASKQAEINRKVASTIAKGGSGAIDRGDAAELARQSAAQLKSDQEIRKNRAAMALDMDRTLQASVKETNEVKLRSQLLLAERRLGLELLSGDEKRIATARFLQDRLQIRLQILAREALADKTRAAEQAKQVETARKRAVEEAKVTAAIEAQARAQAKAAEAQVRAEDKARLARERAANNTPANIAQRGRENTRERLFGDGGAGLFTIQAGLAANYMLLNAARTTVVDALGFAKDLDTGLRALQATVVITDTGLEGLKQNLIEIAQGTKFSAVELTEAAVILGQAGLSLSQIKDTIGAVALLATASGASIKTVTDVTTSVLSVFELEAGQAMSVVNTLTAAVNTSKLDMEKLALGIQYAGNTAASSGLTFEELTAALGAMSNAGIRSGSTLGTGMRQILISLEKPSKAFRETLNRLGLTLSDVDVRTKGLYGAMSNLEKAGFTAGDAIRSFELRGSAAYIALSKNLDLMLDMETSFYDTNAAMLANDTQMRSLSAQSARFGNTLKATVAEGMQPLLFAARDTFKSLGDLLSGTTSSSTGMQILVTAAGSLTLAFAGMGIAKLVTGLATSLLGTTALAGGFGALVTSAQAATASMGLAAGAATFLAPLMPLLIGLTAAVSIGVGAWNSYSNEMAAAETAFGRASATLEQSTGALDETSAKIETVSNKIEELKNRSEVLTQNQRLLESTVRSVKNEFSAMGLDVDGVVGTVDGLITSLEELRTQLNKEYRLRIVTKQEDLKALQVATQGVIANTETNLANTARPDRYTTVAPESDFFTPIKQADVENDPRFKDILSSLDQPNKTALQSEALNRKVKTLVGELRKQRATAEGITAVEEVMLRRLENMQDDLQAVVTQKQNLEAMGRDLVKAEEDLATSNSRDTAEFKAVEGRIDAMKQGVTNAVSTFQSAFKGNAVKEDTMLKRISLSLNRNVEKTTDDIEALVKAGTITRAAGDDLIERLTPIQNSMEEALTTTGEAATPVLEQQAKQANDRLEAAKKVLLEKLGKTNSLTEFAKITKELQENEAQLAVAAARVAEVNMKANGSQEATTAEVTEAARIRNAELVAQGKELMGQLAAKKLGDLYTSATGYAKQGMGKVSSVAQFMVMKNEMAEMTQMAETIARYGANSAQAENLALDAKRKAYKLEVDKLKLGETASGMLMAGFDANPDNKRRDADQERIFKQYEYMGATKRASQEELAAVKELTDERDRQAEVQKVALQYGTDSWQVAEAEVQARRAALVAQLETQGATEAISQATLALFDTTNGVTGATYAWADAMGLVLGQVNGIMAAVASLGGGLISLASKGVEMKALKAGKTAAQARLEAQRYDAAVDRRTKLAKSGSFVETLAIYAGSAVQQAGMIADEQLITARANAPPDRAPKGSGGKGGGGSGPTSKKAIKSSLDALEGNLGAALADDTEKRAERVRAVMKAARDDLENTTARINALQKQDRSVAQQEELNRLVKKRKDLLKFVNDAEEKIRATGDETLATFKGLNVIFGDFIKNNLNMTNILEGGITSALGGWKSAFATLFTDITDGTKKPADAMAAFALSMVKSLQSIVAEMLAVYLLKKALGWLSGAVGGSGFIDSMLAGLEGNREGGRVEGMAEGGKVTGSLARDSQLRVLMPDEYVLRASAAKSIGFDKLDEINSMGNRSLSDSKTIQGVAKPMAPVQAADVNVWVAPPDKRPIPGPNDIVAVISDDISRGGPLKKLIKTVSRQ